MYSFPSHVLSAASVALMVTLPSLANPQGQFQVSASTYEGCYSSAADMTNQGSFQFQSRGYCQTKCGGSQNLPVMGLTRGSDCYCGSTIPANSTKVDDSECNTQCNGFGPEMCMLGFIALQFGRADKRLGGGDNVWSVLLTGAASDFSIASSGSASSPGPAPTSSNAGTSTSVQQPSTITKAGQTIVVTASAQGPTGSSSSNNNSGGSGSSKAGIAAGVVGGVVGVAALGAALFFFMRYKRRQAVEEEYRRNAAVSNFVAPSKARSEGSGGSLNDSRLDPSIMNHRRQSDGSIADERDFSRRILQVCFVGTACSTGLANQAHRSAILMATRSSGTPVLLLR